jgi:tetratricopeptide (TPR) repeat protein
MNSVPDTDSRTRALADLAFGSQTHVAEASRPLAWLSPEEMEIDLSDPVQRRFGDYELQEKIGQGGMGVVYRARQHGLDRDVALKLLAAGPWASNEFVERFRREARSAARMQHPNIVEIYEFGHRDGLNYFSMRIVAGHSLAQRLRSGGPLPARDAAQLLRTLAEAMDYAHRLGVLHLDLKPANILLTETGTPLIADFGLARRIDAGHEGGAQEISGTPSYMAPEQAQLQWHPLSASTDIYGLGAILYETLTGRPPFAASNDQATLHSVVSDAPRPPHAWRTDVPADLEAICLRCLEKEPSARYASARDLAEDLGRFLDNRAVLVRPLNLAQRSLRWAARERRLAGALAALALALVVGATISTVQWRQAESARRLAETQRAEAVRQRGVAQAEAARALRQERRLQQAIGLMGALAPADDAAAAEDGVRYGYRTRVNAVDQARVDQAVSWLEKNASPEDQGEILMAYQRALTDAGKPNQADALVGEVILRFYARYVEQVVADFTKIGSAESLAWASMHAEDPARADQLAREAVAKDPANQVALYAAAARCTPDRTDPCPVPDAAQRLATVDPGNAYNLALAAQARTRDLAELAAQIPELNRAARFDDHSREIFASLQRLVAQSRTPHPAVLSGPAWKDFSEGISGGLQLGVESLFNSQKLLPDWYAVARACDPNKNRALRADQHADCIRFGERVARSPGFPVTQAWGIVTVRRLAKGTPLADEMTEARRRYLWINQQLHAMDEKQVLAIDHERKQQDLASIGELEAYANMLQRVGLSTTPPAGWLPVDRSQMLLPEERKLASR